MPDLGRLRRGGRGEEGRELRRRVRHLLPGLRVESTPVSLSAKKFFLKKLALLFLKVVVTASGSTVDRNCTYVRNPGFPSSNAGAGAFQWRVASPLRGGRFFLPAAIAVRSSCCPGCCCCCCTLVGKLNAVAQSHGNNLVRSSKVRTILLK